MLFKHLAVAVYGAVLFRLDAEEQPEEVDDCLAHPITLSFSADSASVFSEAAAWKDTRRGLPARAETSPHLETAADNTARERCAPSRCRVLPSSLSLPPLPAFQGPRYIGWMGEGETYEVSIKEKEPDGRLFRRILLRTKDREEANALVWSLEQDGQECKLKIIPPGQVE